jgi:UBX domain-containing protein 1
LLLLLLLLGERRTAD